MVREKVIKEFENCIHSGYYNELGKLILHSFNDEPSIEWNDGTKKWYENHKQYWLIDNIRYNTLVEVYKEYIDKIILTKEDISQKLTDNNIDFIYVDTKEGYYEFLILDDSDRNEVILRYG